MSSPFSHPANGVTRPTIKKYTLPLPRPARKPFSPGLRPSSNNGDVGRADCGPDASTNPPLHSWNAENNCQRYDLLAEQLPLASLKHGIPRFRDLLAA